MFSEEALQWLLVFRLVILPDIAARIRLSHSRCTFRTVHTKKVFKYVMFGEESGSIEAPDNGMQEGVSMGLLTSRMALYREHISLPAAPFKSNRVVVSVSSKLALMDIVKWQFIIIVCLSLLLIYHDQIT